MKRLFTILLAVVMGMVAVDSAKASDVFAKNDVLGSVTLGFGHGFGQRFAIDYGVVDGWLNNKASLGIGASLNNTIGWGFNSDVLSLIVNCSFHYQFVDKLDTYVVAGIGGGLGFAGGHVGGGVDWTSALGVRYYFSPTVAFNVEAGHTNSCFVNMGLTFRF